MHELAIAMGIVEAACEGAAGGRVRRVTVEVGALTAVLPDALRFCFDAAARDTDAEGASLDIVEREAIADCRSCGASSRFDRFTAVCRCGSADLAWSSGRELRVVELEVE